MNRMEMAGRLRSLVTTLYRGAPVPAVEGGLFFREVCEERRRAGDMFWTERRVYDLARELGYWPWSIAQIAAAFGQTSPGSGDSAMMNPEAEEDEFEETV